MKKVCRYGKNFFCPPYRHTQSFQLPLVFCFQGVLKETSGMKLELLELHEIRVTCLIETQPAITCSKLTIETLEQSGKYVQS